MRAEEFKKERLLTLNDIKQRVGSLRTKIRTNLQEGGEQSESMAQYEQELRQHHQMRSAKVYQGEDGTRQGPPSHLTTRYLGQNSRAAAGVSVPGIHSGEHSTHQLESLERSMTMDQGAYGNHVIATNQRNGGRVSTKSTKAAKLKGARPNFVMMKDSKSAVQDATKLLQMDSLSQNNMLAMQQFRMPTPTEQDASKIMAGQELKGVNQRQLVGGGKQTYQLTSSVPKSIHSAQPLHNKKHSLEHTRNNQGHIDATASNLSEFHAAEHSRHISKFSHNQQTPIDFR